MQLFRFFIISITLALLTPASSQSQAASFTTPVKLSPAQILKAASQGSTPNAQHRLQMPAQDFAARQAKLIVSSLTEEAELLNYPPSYANRMLSEYRHQN
ncbi:hypothetical protein [Kistimonas asteriae]|uniref:hypothetical protein n=1 Tax=Kistimonas asteriae TaxID=517724 RepID=UPI001BABE99A|nr:hypothetical protein [Kistimonas asteriae]